MGIKRIHLDTRKAMENTKKVADRLTDDPSVNSYLDTMGLIHCRLWFRYRARCIAGVKANAKRSYVDLACRFCTTGSTENQEQEELCETCNSNWRQFIWRIVLVSKYLI